MNLTHPSRKDTAMPTPTMSRDGQYRIELRLTTRVTRADLAGYLASSLRNTVLEELPKLTISQIRENIRNEMERRGLDGLDSWSDRFGMTETKDRLAWAADQVSRAYPELAEVESVAKETPNADGGGDAVKGPRYVVEPVRLGFAVIDTTTGKREARMGSRYAANDMADRLNSDC